MADHDAVKRITSEDVWAADDLDWEDVPVPKWGGVVRVQELTARDRQRYQRSLTKIKGDQTLVDEKGLSTADARLLVMSCRAVDDNGGDGGPFFAEADAEERLTGKSGAAVTTLVAVAMRLSKLRKADVDEMLGNSGTGPTSGSTTT